MRLLACLLTLVCLVGTTAAGAEWDLLIPHEKQTSRLRMNVTLDGKSPEVAWETFLDKLFRYYDRNHDGKLSVEEAKRVIALPLPGNKEALCDLKKMRKETDGGATQAEFKAFYREAGFRPVMVTITPPTMEKVHLGETLFHHLDRDGDGRLSKAELQSAWKLLRRFDDNEDELLTPAELLSGKMPDLNTKPGSTLLKAVPAESTLPPQGVLAISLRRQGTATVVANISDKKYQGDSIQFDLMRNHFRVGGLENADTNPFATSRQFYLALFKSTLGTKTHLDKSALEQDLTLRVLAGFFDAADHDGDGKLTLKELETFFDLIEAGLTAQVLLTIEDQGPNLFEWFDNNKEGTLDFKKLNRAVGLLGEGQSTLELTSVPRQCRLTARIGAILGGKFGPVPIAVTKKTNAPTKEIVHSGPRWFQAMDRNGDGFISRQEFLGSPERFQLLDLDGDGQISQGEAEKANQQ